MSEWVSQSVNDSFRCDAFAFLSFASLLVERPLISDLSGWTCKLMVLRPVDLPTVSLWTTFSAALECFDQLCSDLVRRPSHCCSYLWFVFIEFEKSKIIWSNPVVLTTLLLHSTMRKLKNGVKSGQLWQIISPPIFNENSPNLEGWCKNTKKKIIIDFPNIFKKGFLKL